ncbi:MAG: ATP F0F1 synthase subunit B, partial [Pseudomonadota bacterium]
MGPDEWVAVSFVVFFALVFYAGVHKSAASALDARALSIKEELDQARRLKTEAQTQLAEYQQKR